MGILRNERPIPSNSKDESRPEGIMSLIQQDIESKREEFRTYLERTGVIDAFTRALVSLYEETEKPNDALQYMCKYFAGLSKDDGEVQALKKRAGRSQGSGSGIRS